MHLTPQIFPLKWIHLVFEFGWILIFLWPTKNSKIALNRRQVVARPSSGENGSSAVVACTQERNVLCRQSFHCSHCVAREEFAAKMPTRWVAGGCSNTPDLENGIALHTIPYFGDNRPQVKKRPKKWVYFIKQKRAKWEPSKNLPICSVHFKPEDFQCLFASLPGQGTPSIPRLNRDDFGVVAFPTIHAAGVVIQPPQPERSKRKVRWFDTLFHYKVFLLP